MDHTGPQIHPQFAAERANSPHGSEHSRYSGPMTTASYPSPGPMGTSLPTAGSANIPSIPMGLPGLSLNMMPGPPPVGYKPPEVPQPPAKAYPCSTCGKSFARRSDLARHGMYSNNLVLEIRNGAQLTRTAERIHSGIRPHVCDFPGCGKQFIQRSALTVHQRVHTGEKPHQCERCGKVSHTYPFQRFLGL